MQLIIYPLLSTRYRRAMLRIGGRFGRYEIYVPRGHLLNRLEQQTGLSADAILEQVQKERNFLLQLV